MPAAPVSGASCDDDDAPAGFASPPCFMHELDPAWLGLAPAVDARTRQDVARWRKAERERLIACRMALPSPERADRDSRIAATLRSVIGDPAGRIIGLYWPFRAEPDLRPLMRELEAAGSSAALPVVVERGRPLVYRPWTASTRLVPGVWRIPVPAEGEPVEPDVVIAPVVGFDPACFRLGYGGGFFDRTLAALEPRPLAIGVGYGLAAIPTIYPQPHDIPMQLVITEAGIRRPAEA